MKGPLESAVTTNTFLDVEGKGREVFEQCYIGFVASVHKTENYICNYLKVSAKPAIPVCVFKGLFDICSRRNGKSVYMLHAVIKHVGSAEHERDVRRSTMCALIMPVLPTNQIARFLQLFYSLIDNPHN